MEAVKIEVTRDTLPTFQKMVRLITFILVIFIATMLSDKDVRVIFRVADPRLLFWMGFVCVVAFYLIIKDFQQLYNDVRIVEDLESDFLKISIQNSKLPLEIDQAKSFFVTHFATLCQTVGDISKFKEKALVNQYFRINIYLDLIATLLALSGLAGTIMGLSKALAGITAGESVMQGVAYAFGTTLLGIYGLIVVYIFNNNLREKKREIFYNYLDLMSHIVKRNKE